MCTHPESQEDGWGTANLYGLYKHPGVSEHTVLLSASNLGMHTSESCPCFAWWSIHNLFVHVCLQQKNITLSHSSVVENKPQTSTWIQREGSSNLHSRCCHCFISDGCSEGIVHYCYLDKSNSSHQREWKSIVQLSFTCSPGNRHSIFIHCGEPASKRTVRGPQVRTLSGTSREEKQTAVLFQKWTGL